MAILYVANINFESTANNQLVYNANTITIRAGGADVVTINSTAVTNAAGISVNIATGNNTIANALSVFTGSFVANNKFEVTGAIVYQSNVTPTAIAANTADWAPGVGNVYNIRVSGNNDIANSEYMITGMTAGTNGQVVILNNIGSMGIWIRNEEAGSNGAILPGINVPASTAANRFNLPNHFKLQGYQSAIFYYDGTLARWRLTDSTSIPFDYKNLLTKGFFSGGWDDNTIYYATADRTTYSTEITAAVTGANLSQARGVAAAGNFCKGFFAGGRVPGGFSLVADRTTYSTETTAAVTGANLSQARACLSAAGNACKGFFAGGFTPSPTGGRVTTADRTTYSTETTAAVTGANLTQARHGFGAAGNACKGFFTGGSIAGPGGGTPFSQISNRTTYSTETTAAVPGADLTLAQRGCFAAAGNAYKGFFSGGLTGDCNATNVSERTTYSSETTAAVPGANLSTPRRGGAAAGNSCKGFFAGGLTPTADRTTYSSETTAAVPGANLSQARFRLGAV